MINEENVKECLCKSCNLLFKSKLKTIKEIYNGKEYEYSFQEEFCDICLWKYVSNVDMLETKSYAQEELTNTFHQQTFQQTVDN